MIIGIWRAPLDKNRTLEDYIKFQNEVVVPEMKTMQGLLGIFNFHTETEWGTIQLWESHEADLAERREAHSGGFRARRRPSLGSDPECIDFAMAACHPSVRPDGKQAVVELRRLRIPFGV